MLDVALKLISKIEAQGFKAYIVGGFVRNYILGIESNDVDICTNAKPKDIRELFLDKCFSKDDYGSVTVIHKHIKFEITTFRKEYTYHNHRKPLDYEYIDDLYEDLKRRDFLINTLCMDINGNIIDLLNGKIDIKNKIIRTVGDSLNKLEEDSLRILRAVRFATQLNFELSLEIKKAISKTKNLLKNLSYERKKEELDKIFTSSNVMRGVFLLIELELDKVLELDKLKDIECFDDLMGIWAQLEVAHIYHFTNNEKELTGKICEALQVDNLDNYNLYKYGLYVSSIVGAIKKLDKKEIITKYNNLQIKTKKDLALTGQDILKFLEKDAIKFLKRIIQDIEYKVVINELNNNRTELLNYVLNNYSNLIIRK